MRKAAWTPSIVPRGDDHDVYLRWTIWAGSAGSGWKPITRRPITKPS
jgi:hypothetical protein